MPRFVPLVLASSSPYRRAQLERLGLPFRWQAPAIDERARNGEKPRDLVRRLSLDKARAVGTGLDCGVVIGGDQVAICNGRVVGKPGAREPAIAQLEAAAGTSVRFLSGVCVLDAASGRAQCEVVPTDVVFRTLTRDEIETYVDREQPYDCAGSFKAESLGIVLFERIVSDDPTALTGLPLIALARLLATFGIDVLRASPGASARGSHGGENAGAAAPE